MRENIKIMRLNVFIMRVKIMKSHNSDDVIIRTVKL